MRQVISKAATGFGSTLKASSLAGLALLAGIAAAQAQSTGIATCDAGFKALATDAGPVNRGRSTVANAAGAAGKAR